MPKKILKGKVINNKCNNTISVLVQSTFTDPLYRKIIRRSKKYAVHDSDNNSKIGDMVTIIESRPISKTKRWRLYENLSVSK